MARHAFYYTDPVAALWMAKAFRLRLAAGAFCLQPESVDAFLDLLARGARPDRYVVTPDSLPVLDPRPGDVVEEGELRPKVRRLAAKDFPLAGTTYRILQRSGQPFFTPQRTAE